MTRNQKKKLDAATKSSSSFDLAMDSQNFQPVVGLRASIQPSTASKSNKSSDFAEKHSEGQRAMGSSSSKAPSAMALGSGFQQAAQPVNDFDSSMPNLPSDLLTNSINSENQIVSSSNKKVRERSKSIEKQQSAAANSMKVTEEQRDAAANPLGPIAPLDLRSMSSPSMIPHGLEVGKSVSSNPHDIRPASTVVNMQVNETAGVLDATGAHSTDCSREIVGASPVVNMQVDGLGAHVTECSRLNDHEYPSVQSCYGKGVPPHDSTNIANKSKAPWLDVVKNNRKVGFMGPLIEITEGVTNFGVQLVESDVIIEEELEARCLIGMFNGKFPGDDMLQKMVDNWPKRCTFNKHRTGWIVFKFDDASDLQFVLRSASFYAANKPMTVKQMPRHFHFSKEDFSLVPTWVQFPNLPLSCWKSEALRKICTFIGVPLFVDKITKDHENISFARCLIEVDAIEELPDSMILTMPNGKQITQCILYEDPPKWCQKCKRLGHMTNECYATSTPSVSVYVAKSRTEATQNKRGRSRKRKGSSRPPADNRTRPANIDRNTVLGASTTGQLAGTAVQGAETAVLEVETAVQEPATAVLEVETVRTMNAELGANGLGAVNVSNSFSPIGSWAEDTEKEDGNKKASTSNDKILAASAIVGGMGTALGASGGSKGKDQYGKEKTLSSNLGAGKGTLKASDPRLKKPPSHNPK